jgi:hypothetical protein
MGPAGGPPGSPGGGPGGGGGRGGGPNTLIIAIVALVAVIAVAAVGFVVLGGDDDDSTDTADQAADDAGDAGDAADDAVEPRDDVTVADLEPVLLTTADVPAGYTQVEWVDDDADALTPEDVEATPECEAALERFGGTDASRQETGAEFEMENGANIEHTLSAAVAGDVTVAEVQAGMTSCGTFSYDDDGQVGTVTLTAEPLSGIGDAAVGVSMVVETSVEGTPVTAEMYGVLADRDGIHSSVAVTGGFPEDALTSGGPLVSDPPDRDAAVAMAETVDADIQASLGG